MSVCYPVVITSFSKLSLPSLWILKTNSPGFNLHLRKAEWKVNYTLWQFNIDFPILFGCFYDTERSKGAIYIRIIQTYAGWWGQHVYLTSACGSHDIVRPAKPISLQTLLHDTLRENFLIWRRYPGGKYGVKSHVLFDHTQRWNVGGTGQSHVATAKKGPAAVHTRPQERVEIIHKCQHLPRKHLVRRIILIMLTSCYKRVLWVAHGRSNLIFLGSFWDRSAGLVHSWHSPLAILLSRDAGHVRFV